jgi:hypothetical protein
MEQLNERGNFHPPPSQKKKKKAKAKEQGAFTQEELQIQT